MSGDRVKHISLIAVFIVALCSAGLSQLILDLVGGKTPQVARLFMQKPTKANLRAFEADLQDNCQLAKRLRPWMQYARFMILGELGDEVVAGRCGWLFYKPAVQYLIEPGPPQTDESQGDIFSAVISFHDQLANRGIQLILVPVPNKASVYPDMLTPRARTPDIAVSCRALETISRLRQAGIEVVDLFAVFGQARAALPHEHTATYYLSQDSHWSPSGVQLAAKTVGQRILELGWAKKGHVEYALEPVMIQRHGDILTMIQVPQVERHFEPEHIHCTQVVNSATNQPYRDDSNSEILVIGDSFLRIYSRDEPGTAGFVEHLGQELGLPVTSIVNDGGASTLVRQQLSRNPKLLANKKVVVWEFVERDIRFGTEGWQIVPLP